jgi:hypothetical protein
MIHIILKPFQHFMTDYDDSGTVVHVLSYPMKATQHYQT